MRLRALPTVAVLLLTACARPRAPEPPAVVVDYASAPVSLVPGEAAEEVSYTIQGNVYEPLVDRDTGMSIRPGLATSWNDDAGRVWTFRLRAGVKFHDGRELTARDVIASLESQRAGSPLGRTLLAPVERLEAPDARTVVLHLRTPLFDFPQRVTLPVFRPAPGPGKFPIGTGPYRITFAVAGGATVLTAFEGYREPVPIPRLEFHAVPRTAERIARLTQGDSHVFPDVPQEAFGPLRAAKRVRLQTVKGLRVLLLGMDARAPTSPFRDPRVRRAVALAVDRAALVAGPLGGLGEPIDQVVTRGVFGYAEGLPPVPHDPAEARRLLAAAGYAGGFETRLEFMPAKYRAMPEVARALGESLGAVGIRTVERPYEVASFLEHRKEPGNALFLLGWMTTGWDAGVTYDELLHTRDAGRGPANTTGYSSPEADALIEAAEGEARPRERQEIYGRLARLLLADLPLVPLYHQYNVFATAQELEVATTDDRRLLGLRMGWTRR